VANIDRLSIAIIVSFLNEGAYLPTFLASIDGQTRRPDLLLLVDDGSSDRSMEIAQEFAAQRPYVRVLRRPPRSAERDRLATAAELKSFEWAREQLDRPYDIVAKMDADLELKPTHVETVAEALEADPELGIVGGHLSMVLPDGSVEREKRAVYHVRGPNKFYRRECLEQIQPIEAILGWDTIDDVKARMAGWRTTTVEIPGGDSIHLRPTGTHDGSLRGYARWGQCAFAVGTPFPAVLAGAAVRMQQRPRLLGGLAYVYGWIRSVVRRDPRAEGRVRSYYRTEQYRRMASPFLSRLGISVDTPLSPHGRYTSGR
jgi:biofilm PGA synthesis N-glycosyltransferase PgaC